MRTDHSSDGALFRAGRWSLVFWLATLLSGVAMYLFWPVFDLDFWIEFLVFSLSLPLALGLGAWPLLRSKRLLGKLGGGALALLGLGWIVLIAYLELQLVGAGATIELLPTPERSAHPQGPTVHLAYLHVRSTSERPGSPIVYLAGGPGGPGSLSMMLTKRYPVFMAMREFGDIIALDQRGTMPWNDPWLMCPETWDYPLELPYEPERAAALAIESAQACRAYFQTQGVDLGAYNTLESVEDLESLRIQLRSEQLTLWGTSYGTHLALAYLKRHPSRVDRMILHGVEGLDHTLKLPSQVQAALEDTSAWAAVDEVLEGRLPDLLGDVHSLLARVEDDPITVPLEDGEGAVSVVLGKFDLQLLTALRLRSFSSRRDLPIYIAEMGRGDFTRFASQARSLRRGSRLSLMSLNMDCASGASNERLKTIREEARHTLLGDAINEPFPAICEAADAVDLGPEFRAPVRSDVPVLVISGTMDGRTPIRNAEETLQGFPNGQHVIVEGAGHGDELFVSSAEILTAMQQFMRGDTLTRTRIHIPRHFDPL